MLDSALPVDSKVVPFSLKDAPSLIERLLPAQKISIESQKERKAGAGQTLTALGSYWKGRKPLVLVRACVLGALLPATGNDEKDLTIFERLMGIDDEAFAVRLKKRLTFEQVETYSEPHHAAALIEYVTDPRGIRKPKWRKMPKETQEHLMAEVVARMPYGMRMDVALRPEEVGDDALLAGVWDEVNAHLGTSASSMPEFVEQLGIMRFGHRPKVADTFCGGGSIPFEAARLGCDVYASDLNPIACMLTWGALNIIGANEEKRAEIERAQQEVAAAVDKEITTLGIEHDGDESYLRLGMDAYVLSSHDWKIGKDGVVDDPERPPFEVVCPRSGWRVPLIRNRQVSVKTKTILRLVPIADVRRYDIRVESGVSESDWEAAALGTIAIHEDRVHLRHDPGTGETLVPVAHRAKAYLYCLETRCPRTGWMVPMAPSWVISKTRNVVAKLIPDHANKRFDIQIESGVSSAEMKAAEQGTVQKGNLVYDLDGETHTTPIKLIRGDFRKDDGASDNKLRRWEKHDFVPRPDDIFQERLYCIQWIASGGIAPARQGTFFAGVTEKDLERERTVEAVVRDNLSSWQDQGFVPDMEIEPGENTRQPIWERGWTHWHHLFGARQLLVLSKILSEITLSHSLIVLAKLLDWNNRLCTWNGGLNNDKIEHLFYNQAINTVNSYGVRGLTYMINHWQLNVESDSSVSVDMCLRSGHAGKHGDFSDLFITDPPYADAVNYHEITEFFIAWLRKNPPAPFDEWTWDSRRALAVKGDGDEFRREMVRAYKAMADHMPDNGLQIVMFTHQAGAVWADMAAIMWAAGLKVTGAWYISTETTSEMKKGGYVQGTVLLVLRKRFEDERAYEDELAAEIKQEVVRQMETLTGLNQKVKARQQRDENLFEDADLQMAGYAAALRVLTGYRWIGADDMTQEALRPRRKGEVTNVDKLIEMAVGIATEYLVPEGLSAQAWERRAPEERFYLKMLELEAEGTSKLDNYQNFAKAYRVADYQSLMGDMKPSAARLKTAIELRRSLADGVFGKSVVRAILFAVRELAADADGKIVLHGFRDAVPDYWRAKEDERLEEIVRFIARKTAQTRPQEAAAARILVELIANDHL